MKKTRLLYLGLLIVAASCKKSDTSPSEQAVSVSNLSDKIVQYVDNNYPDAYISSAVSMNNSQAKYIVTLNTTEELAFDPQNNYLGFGEGFHHHHEGNHHHEEGSCHHEDGYGTDIPVDSLSGVITGYINTHYSGYSVKHADSDSICSFGKVIEVMIRQNESQPTKLVFDNAGNFKASGARFNFNEAPAAVKNFISTNYSNFKVRERSVRYILSNASIYYRVFLENNTTHKRLFVDDAGNLICEQ